MSKRTIIFILFLSVSLMCVSLYLISTLDPGIKPRPTPVVTNLTPGNVKIDNQFQLRTTDDVEFDFASLENKFTLMYFGFSYCPDTCPITLQKISEVIKFMTPEELEKTQFIFVSVDPERDTLSSLKKFTEQFSDRIIGVTGSQKELNRIAKSIKVYYNKIDSHLSGNQVKDTDNKGVHHDHGAATSADQGSDDYYVDHSPFIYLFNTDAQLVSQFTQHATAGDIYTTIKTKMSEEK